jgi:hypothetical protein
MTKTNLFRMSAAGLVAGALLFTVADLLRRLVEPSGSPDAAAITRAVGDHQAVWLLAGLCSVLAAVGLVVGALGLLVSAGGRGAALTRTGAGLLTVGAFASVGHAVAFYAPYALFDKAGTPSAALTALDDASEGYPLLVVLIIAFAAGTMAGSLVLLVGLRRARRVPVWAVVAALVFVVCGSSSGTVPGVLGVVAATLAFGPAARALAGGRPGRPVVTATGSEVGEDRAEQLAHP